MVYRDELNIIQGVLPPKVQYSESDFDIHDTSITVYADYKISVLLTDDLAALLDGKVYNTIRGDVLLFRPDEIHCGRVFRAGLHRYLDFFIPAEMFNSFKEDCSTLMYILSDKSSERVNHISPSDADRDEVLRISENVIRLIISNDPLKRTLIFSNMLELLALCRRLYSEQLRNPRKNNTPATVSTAICYINKYFADITGLSEIASHSNCSITYLTRSFRRFTGRTVNSYLNECRLFYAKKLLREGLSVTEACYRSGFGDCSHFIRVFRKSEGFTPYQYRKASIY